LRRFRTERVRERQNRLDVVGLARVGVGAHHTYRARHLCAVVRAVSVRVLGVGQVPLVRYLPELGFAAARHEFRADSAAGLRAVRTRPDRLQETDNPMPAHPAPSMEVML